MDAAEKTENIEKKSLMLVLEEFTQEQERHSKSINDLVAAVNGLTDRFKSFEEKLDNPKPLTISTDTTPVQDIVKKGIIDMKLVVAAQPKNVLRKFQLLLFPEQDARLFYKVIFGRWFLWLIVMLFLNNFYKWGIHWSDSKKEVALQQLKNNRIKKAWNYLYSRQGERTRRLMDSAYLKVYE